MLPQYSGGLGILAGDHLKSASDLGRADRRRRPVLPARLLPPVALARRLAAGDATRCSTPTGCRCRCCASRTAPGAVIALGLPGGRRSCAHVWQAQVGRVPLLLLDTDIEDNDERPRDVTDRLYGGGGEHRLLQELLLGIGGVRALRALRG